MIRFSSLARIAARLLRKNILITIIYRAQLVVWLISGVAPLFMMLVWREVSRDRIIGGYTPSDFVEYFLGIYLVRQLTAVWVIFILNDEIRQGTLGGLLLKPISAFWFHTAEHVGQMLVRAPIVVSVFGAGALLFAVDLQIIMKQVPLFLIAFILAWIIIFHIYYCVGLLAFWTANSIALDAAIWSMYTVLGSTLIPVDLFPEATRSIILLLPFAAALDFPVKVLLDNATVDELLRGFSVQLFWVLILIALRLTLWRQGLKRFSGAGI